MATLLFVASWLVPWLWKRGHDPDNFSIPYLTAIGDLVGGLLLAVTFHVLHMLHDSAVETESDMAADSSAETLAS